MKARGFCFVLFASVLALLFGAGRAAGAVGSDLPSTTFTRDLLRATNAADGRAKLSIVTSNWAANANQFNTTGNQLNAKDGILLTNPVVNSGTIVGNAIGLTNLPVNLPTVTVSPAGIANGLSSKTNNGADYGPDTAGTTTAGIQEALNALPTATNYTNTFGGGKIVLQRGIFNCTGQIVLPNTYPFYLVLEGQGKTASLILYSNTTVQDFVVTGRVSTDTTNSSLASLNLVCRDVGFVYQQSTNRAHLLHLNWVNEPAFYNCLFSTRQVLALDRVGASLEYTEGTPSNAVGVVGCRINGRLSNLASFNGCSFYGLACGALIGSDMFTFADCMFANIGIYYPDHTAGSRTAGTAWTNGVGSGQLYTNIYSAGVGIVAFSGNNRGNIDRCMFFQCGAAVMQYVDPSDPPLGLNVIVHYPWEESVNYDFLSNDGDIDSAAYWIGNGGAPNAKTWNVDTAVVGTSMPSTFTFTDTGSLFGWGGVVGGTVGGSQRWKVDRNGNAIFAGSLTNTGMAGTGVRFATVDANGKFVPGPATNAFAGGSTFDSFWRTNGGTYFSPASGAGTYQVGIATNSVPESGTMQIRSLDGGSDGIPRTLLLSTLDADSTVGIQFVNTDNTHRWGVYRVGGKFKLTDIGLGDYFQIDETSGRVEAEKGIQIGLTADRIGRWDSNSVMIATNPVANWPTSAIGRGASALVNSNGTLYIFNSAPASTTWTSTNMVLVGQVILGSATLNFGALSPNTTEDQTISLAGVQVGDIVEVGPPAAAQTADVSYFGFVGVTGVVSIRAINNSGVEEPDPGSGTFKVKVTHF